MKELEICLKDRTAFPTCSFTLVTKINNADPMRLIPLSEFPTCFLKGLQLQILPR